MEWVLYYSYLKFQKERTEKLSKSLARLPVAAVLLVCLVCLQLLAVFVLAFIPSVRTYMWIPLLIDGVCCVVLYGYTEYYQVKMSHVKLEDYRAHCRQVYDWLQSCSISSQEDIQKIRERLVAYIDKAEAKRKYKNEQINKWLQVLCIPVTLTVLSAYISRQTDFERIWEYSFSVVFICILIYAAVVAIRNVLYVFSASKLSRIRRFVDDLQGVLDMGDV